MVDTIALIEKYYTRGSKLYNILLSHSEDVTQKALNIAKRHPELGIDKEFVEEAGMLHDIGIFMTSAPSIDCFGSEPYLRHGVLGSRLLQEEGLPIHSLVCERHTGAGLTKDEIITQHLPLPYKNMMPISIEEQVICFADCFFSKTHLGEERSIEKVKSKLSEFGDRSVMQFEEWCEMFL